MSISFVTELLKLDRMVGDESIQTMVEADVVVPDSKPDISRIVSVEGDVKILEKEIMQEKIVVEGVVNFKILYASDNLDQPIHSMKASAGFNQNIEIDGIDSTMRSFVNYSIEHMDYNIVNERKVSLKTVLNLTGKVYKTEEIDVVKEIEGMDDVQALKDFVRYDNVIGSNSSQTVLRETFELTENAPEIYEVLDVKGIPVVNESRVTDGKVIVGGNLKIRLLYATEEPRNPVHEVKHEIPFTHFVEVPNALNDMDSKVNLRVDEIFTEIKKNIEEQNKVYNVEAVIKADVEVFENDEKEILLDAYSPSRNINLSKSKIKFLRSAGQNSSQTVIKETLDVPEGYPNIFKVFAVKGNPVITNYKLIEEKSVIEGFISTDVLYVADNEELRVYSFRQEIPFRHHVEIPGAHEDMISDIKLDIEDIDFASINSKQIEAKFNLNASCSLSEDCETEAVTNAEDLGEIQEEDRASITVYFVQEGDTLWNIAKRYNTTVKEILEANDLADPEAVKPGDYIIIQKTYEYKF